MCCAVNGDLSQDPDIPSRPKEVQRTPQGRSTTAGSVHCKAEGVILLAACDRRCHRGAGYVGDNQKPEAEDFRFSAQIASICSLGSGSWKSTAAVKAGGSHNRSPTHSCVKYHGAVSRRIVLRPTCCRRFVASWSHSQTSKTGRRQLVSVCSLRVYEVRTCWLPNRTYGP